MRIEVTGRLPAGRFAISRARLAEAARYFAERSRRRTGKTRWNGVTVILVGDDLSAAAHLAIMGIEGATDVITQAYNSIPPEPEGIEGELVVNVQRALEAHWSPEKELLLYVAHGMDHLSGADDLEEADRRAMRRRELGWIGDFLSRK